MMNGYRRGQWVETIGDEPSLRIPNPGWMQVKEGIMKGCRFKIHSFSNGGIRYRAGSRGYDRCYGVIDFDRVKPSTNPNAKEGVSDWVTLIPGAILGMGIVTFTAFQTQFRPKGEMMNLLNDPQIHTLILVALKGFLGFVALNLGWNSLARVGRAFNTWGDKRFENRKRKEEFEIASKKELTTIMMAENEDYRKREAWLAEQNRLNEQIKKELDVKITSLKKREEAYCTAVLISAAKGDVIAKPQEEEWVPRKGDIVKILSNKSATAPLSIHVGDIHTVVDISGPTGKLGLLQSGHLHKEDVEFIGRPKHPTA